jgi:hypothetical protein
LMRPFRREPAADPVALAEASREDVKAPAAS